MDLRRATLLAWCLVVPSAARAGEVLLEWKLAPGLVLEQLLEYRWTSDIQGPSRPEWENRVTHSLQVWTTWLAARGEREGTARVSAFIDRIRFREDKPGLEPLEYDFTSPAPGGKKPMSGSPFDGFVSLAGAKCLFDVTARGIIEGFEIEYLGRTPNQEDRKDPGLTAQAMSWFLAFPPLPPGPCREGSTWDHEVKPLEAARVRQETTCVYRGLVQEGGREQHLIQTTSRLRPVESEKGTEDVEMIDSSGEVRFDAELQRMVERKERSRFRMREGRTDVTTELEILASLREKDAAPPAGKGELSSSSNAAREAEELTRLGKALLQRGRDEEAEEPLDRAMAICRGLMANLSANESTEVEENLAWSLSLRAEIGPQESTVPLLREAAYLHRSLIQKGLTKYEPDLASNLTKLGYALRSSTGERFSPELTAEANRSFSEAIEIYGHLADTRPSDEDVLRARIRALDGRAFELARERKYAEAAEDHGDRIAIYRLLVDERRRKHLERELADALRSRADALMRAEEHETALEDLDAAIAITNHLHEEEERRTRRGVYYPMRTTDIDLPARLLRAQALMALRRYDLAVVDLDLVELHAPLEGSFSMMEWALEAARGLREHLCEKDLLPWVNPPEEKPIEAWLDQLDSGDREKRLRAMGALRALDLENRVPALARASRKADPLVQEIAIRELGRLGPRAREAVPALIDALERRSRAAVMALAEMGPEAREALPALEKLLSERRGTTSEEALVEAIEKIRSASP